MPFQALMRFFRPKGEAGAATYGEIVANARLPLWYRDGGVADTMEGRFAVLCTLTAMQIVRLERGGREAQHHSAALTETFIADMETQLRESGVSDPAIGKRVRALVGSLAARTERWRNAVGEGSDRMEAAARMNLFGETVPTDKAVTTSVSELMAMWDRTSGSSDPEVMTGYSL